MRILRQTIYFLAYFLICAVVGSMTAHAQSVRAWENVTAPTSQIEGTWAGLFRVYPNLMAATLEVPPLSDSGQAAATMKLEALGGARGAPKGEVSAIVEFDTSARTVKIALGPDAAQMRFPNLEFYGFLDEGSAIFSGYMRKSPPNTLPLFVFRRPATSPDSVFLPIVNAEIAGKNRQGGRQPPSNRFDRTVLENWARRFVDEYPETDVYRMESGKAATLTQVLFADQHFAEYFGAPFDQMPASELKGVFQVIRNIGAPRSNSAEDRLNGTIRSVQGKFRSGSNGNKDGLFAALALRHISGWRAGAQGMLDNADGSLESFRAGLAINASTGRIEGYAWPSDLNAFRSNISRNLARLAAKPLEQEVARLLAAAPSLAAARQINSALSLRPTTRLSGSGPSSALAELVRWAPDTWRTLQPQLDARLDSILPKLVGELRSEAAFAGTNIDSPIDKLIASKGWFERHRVFIEEFSGRASVASLLSDLAASREAAFASALPALNQELQNRKSPAEVNTFANSVSISMDRSRSESWRRFEQSRVERLLKIDRDAMVARVGEGPFNVGYPGAAYLNAIYRNDQARLNQEDKAIYGPMATAFASILNSSGLAQLFPLVAGDAATPDQLTQAIKAQIANQTFAAVLAGFYVISYERVWPGCMDADTVTYVQSVEWETVVKNGFGTELYSYPSGYEEYRYTINRRHKQVFESVGVTTNPEELDFMNVLFGPLMPADVRESQTEISDILRGLRLAMTQNACDSAIIKTLEGNMIHRALAL